MRNSIDVFWYEVTGSDYQMQMFCCHVSVRKREREKENN